jgi:hypothetical protein
VWRGTVSVGGTTSENALTRQRKVRSLQGETPIKFKSDSSVVGSDVRSQSLKFTFGVRWVSSFRSILLLLSLLGFSLIPLSVSW